jgi:putative Holliday junction resolvase
MGRIMGIDYGSKKTGIAVTDPLKIIAQPLATIPTEKLYQYLVDYQKTETLEAFVVGMPSRLNGEDTHATQPVKQFIEALKQAFPNIPVHTIDERFSSSEAFNSLIASGAKKEKRAIKELLDSMSASLILQTHLQSIQ